MTIYQEGLVALAGDLHGHALDSEELTHDASRLVHTERRRSGSQDAIYGGHNGQRNLIAVSCVGGEPVDVLQVTGPSAPRCCARVSRVACAIVARWKIDFRIVHGH